MRIKRLTRISSGITITLLAVLSLSLLLPVVAAAPVSIGRFRLDDPGNYLFGDSGVTAKIKFVDDGTTLKIVGHAKGLTPGVPYASLIYDIASSDEGPFACEPGIFNPFDPNFIIPTMFVGFWDVKKSGAGTLKATNIVDDGTGLRVYVPLSKIATISIRDFTVPNPLPPGFPGSGPAAVVACGEVVVHPGG